MRNLITSRAVLVAAICASIPCLAASGPTLGAGGPFSARVSGAVATQITGDATSMGRTADSWQAQLQSPTGDSNILLITSGSGRPAPGTYAIADMNEHGGNAPVGQYTAMVALANGGPNGPAGFSSVSGTLTITASSSGAVEGSFNFVARDGTDPTRTVTVGGSFTTTNEDIS